MDILLNLLGLIFVSIGVLASFKWILNGGTSGQQHIVKGLRKLADRQTNSHYAEMIRTLAKGVEGDYLDTIAPFDSPPQSQHYSQIAPQAASSFPAVSPNSYAEQANSASSPPTMNKNVGEIFTQLNNINVLLFLGAFMVVVSVGIFVGFNFGTLSGEAKTAFVAVFALLFYASGLALVQFSAPLRPAGLTFSAIGLVLLPLVGLAYYNFMPGASSMGPGIWVAVSVISLLAGLITYMILRQQYVNYFTIISLLSLTESVIHAANLPVYYLAWGILLTAAILTLLAKVSYKDKALTEPMFNSSVAMAPASVILSLFYMAEQGIGQLGVTALLSAVYYELSSHIVRQPKVISTYYVLSRALLAVGVILLAADADLGSLTSGLVVSIAGLVITILSMYELAKGRIERAEVAAFIGGITSVAAAGFAFSNPQHLTLLVAIAAGVNLAAAMAWRFTSNLLLGAITLLMLPAVAILSWINPENAEIWASLAYIILGVGFIWLRGVFTHWKSEHVSISQFGYIISLITALVLAATAGRLSFILLGVLISAIIYAISFIERRPTIALVAATTFYVAVSQIVPEMNADSSYYVAVLGLAGLMVYVLGVGDSRTSHLRLSGIIGVGLGAAAGNVVDQESIATVASLLGIAALLYVESRRSTQKGLTEASVGFVVLAIAKLLWFSGISMTAVYANLAGLYFGWMAYVAHRKLNTENRTIFLGAALASITIPIGLESLAIDGQLHGLILTIECIVLVLLGIALQLRLVWMWAVATLVTEVLYQSRDYIFALPKYIITALLGLGLLGGAIWLLMRRSKSDL